MGLIVRCCVCTVGMLHASQAVPQQRPKAFAVELLKSGRHGSAKVEEEASSSFTADEDNPYSTGGEANGGAEGRGARGGPP